MTLRAKTLLDINELKTFLDDENIGREEIVFFARNASGAHDIVYNDTQDGAASLKSGATSGDRAVYGEVGVDAPLDATQFVAGGTTMTFAASGGTVTRSAGSFLTDGYLPGMRLTVAGTVSNDDTYYITTVTALVITIDPSGSSVDSTFGNTFVDEGPLSGAETLDGQQYGYFTNGAKNVHVVVYLPDATTTLNWSLYTYDSASEQWTLDTRPGTDGVVARASDTDTDNPQRTIIEIPGVERVLVVIDTSTGTFTVGYSVWLLGSG